MLLAVLAVEPVFFEQGLHLDGAVVRVQVRCFAHATSVHPVRALVLIYVRADQTSFCVDGSILNVRIARQVWVPRPDRIVDIAERSALVLSLGQQERDALAYLRTRDLPLAHLEPVLPRESRAATLALRMEAARAQMAPTGAVRLASRSRQAHAQS